MANSSHYFKLGLFVLVGITLVTTGIVIFGARALFEDKFHLETYIDQSVQGLEVGSPVKTRGVKIGSVDQIILLGHIYDLDNLLDSLHPEEAQRYERYVYVRMAVDPKAVRIPSEKKIKQQIKKAAEFGMRVRLASQGITGVAYIEADYVDPEKYPIEEFPWKPKYPYVPSVPSTMYEMTNSIKDVLEKLETIGSGVNHLTEQISLVFDKSNRQNIARTLESLENLSANLNQGWVRNEPQLKQLISELRMAVNNINSLTEQVSMVVDERNRQHLAETLDNIAAVSYKLDQGLAENEPKMSQLMVEIRVTLKSLTRLLEDIGRQPNIILFGREVNLGPGEGKTR